MGQLAMMGALMGIMGAGANIYGANQNRQATKAEIEAAQRRYEQGIAGVGNTFYGGDLWSAINSPPKWDAPTAPSQARDWTGTGATYPNGEPKPSWARNEELAKNAAAWADYDKQMQQWNATAGSRAKTTDDYNAWIRKQTGGSVLDQYKDLTRRSGTARAGIMGQYNAETNALAAGDDRAYNQAASYFGGARNAVDQLGAGQEAMASQWGRGANALIDEQSGIDLKRANQSAMAMMAGRGLGGSSMNAMMQAGNARAIGRDARQQKLAVSQGALDRTMAARQSRTGTLASMYGQAGTTLASLGDASRGRAYGRAAGRTEQQYANLNTDLGYRQQIPNTMLGLAQGSLNPGGIPYIPNPYGAGAGMVDLGSALGGTGGTLMGAYLQNNYAKGGSGGQGPAGGSGRYDWQY